MLNKLLLIFLATFVFQVAYAASEDTADKWVDLTHDFAKETIYWPTAQPFELQKVFEGVTPSGYFYSAFQFKGAEHGGTHLDAPYHFAKSGKTVEQIDLDQIIGPAIVIDVSQNALKDPDYQITVDDLKNWEKLHGNIPKNSIILLYTGYSAFWPDKQKYLGTTETGEEGVAKLHFPGLSPTAASWLAKRGIKAIGIDTASIDYGQSKTFKSHRILARNNIPIFENIANLNVLPEKGADIIALPMKIKEGSGAPLRIIAKLPKSQPSKVNGSDETNNKEEKK